MLEKNEIIAGILVPVALAAVLAAIAAWRRWPWAMPLAAAVGFLTGYAASMRSIPRLGPTDGSDWLFWLTIPLAGVGVVCAMIERRWAWISGACAGAATLVLLRPLADMVTPSTLWPVALATAAAGAALVWIIGFTQPRTGSIWTSAALCVAMGGAGVVIFASGSRTIGLHGISAAAALGPVAVFSFRTRAPAAVAVAAFAVPLLAGFLVAGHFYAEATWTNLIVLLASPALLLVGAWLPTKRQWVRGLVGLIAVMIAVAAVTGPTALAAKKAAEGNEYEMYK
jgi:hypothetical protein